MDAVCLFCQIVVICISPSFWGTVWMHWGWTMSGIGGLVIQLIERIVAARNSSPPQGQAGAKSFTKLVLGNVFWIGGAIVLFFAFFLAWRDQKQIAVAALAKAEDKPSLWAEFQNANWFPGDQINEKTHDFGYAEFYICINTKLGNNGSPTAVQNWKFAIPEYKFTSDVAPLSMFTTNPALSVTFGPGKSYFG